MAKMWWKILGVFFVAISILAGLLIPLGPGISSADSPNFESGNVATVAVKGYNTHFKLHENELKFWLRNDDKFFICGENTTVIDDKRAVVHFNIPKELRKPSFDLIMAGGIDGTSLLPRAFFVSSDSYEKSAGEINPLCTETVPIIEPGYTHFPYREMLFESIRNLFFHVAILFAMMILLLSSVVYSIKYLRGFNIKHDLFAHQLAVTGIIFGLLGVATGMIWANYTWGSPWTNDPKLNGTAISLLVYIAYLILRNSIDEEQKRARISAVYNIFAFVILIVFIMVLPRLAPSLHPGNGGNPAFGTYDLNNTMRPIFYIAIIGWTLIGLWIATIKLRIRLIKRKKLDLD